MAKEAKGKKAVFLGADLGHKMKGGKKEKGMKMHKGGFKK